MALSPEEEQAFSELEARFHAADPPRHPAPRPPYLTFSLAFDLGGAALLAAARHRGLLIVLSDHLGFATSSIASVLAVAGYAALLVAAFLLGRRQTGGDRSEEVAREIRPVPTRR
jgi:hypothetical protein